MTTTAPSNELTRLAGDWWIHQASHGQRYSTDDVLVAWEACRARPAARTVLDLGAGVGSVGLMALIRLGERAQLTSVERLDSSVELLTQTVATNGLEPRVEILAADLRTPDLLGDRRFDLVVANPPYLPPGSAQASPHPARAAARLELYGDIGDYCRVAAAHLAPGGRFCFCHQASDPRPERVISEAGLALLSRREVVFRSGQPPHLALYVAGASGVRTELPMLEVRSADGARTPAFRAVRRQMSIEA